MPKSMFSEICTFFDDKGRVDAYLQAVNDGKAGPDTAAAARLLKLEKKWKHFPPLARSLRGSLQQLKEMHPEIGEAGNALNALDGEYQAGNVLDNGEAFGESPKPGTENPQLCGIRHSYTSLPSHSLPSHSPPLPSPPAFLLPPSSPKRALTQTTLHPIPLSSRHAKAERKRVAEQQGFYERRLDDILSNRLQETLEFGRQFSVSSLAHYMEQLFGETLAGDGLLALVQQYSLANAPIVNPAGTQIGSTGFNLSFFGDPGTGKTFAIKDLILGNESLGVKPHGLIGRNRYCGTITTARFVRMAEAYRDQAFNFIVPEFHNWFQEKKLVNTMKAAMEGSLVEYETFTETIGPYPFNSFFSVNYNVSLSEDGYHDLMRDPHFKAIEDRMLNNLHRMTTERYQAVADSKRRLENGLMSMELAERIQDHLLLLHAIQTEHPKVRDYFPRKAVCKAESFDALMSAAREGVLYCIKQAGMENGKGHGDGKGNDQGSGQGNGRNAGSDSVPFSPRLEKRTLQLAAAMSLPGYFREEFREQESLPMSGEAVTYALRFFVQEAAVRSKGMVDAAYVLGQMEQPRNQNPEGLANQEGLKNQVAPAEPSDSDSSSGVMSYGGGGS